MSSIINDIIVNIVLSNVTLTGKSFRPLIMAKNAGAGIQFAVCTNLTDVIAAGYLATDKEYLMAAALLAQPRQVADFAVIRLSSASGSYVQSLTALKAQRQDWYHVLIDDRAAASGVDTDAVGAWAQSNGVMFWACASGSVVAGVNGFPANGYTGVFPSAQSRSREAVMIHDSPNDYPECAWVGAYAPYLPGQASAKFKQLQGQKNQNFDQTSLTNIRSAKMCALQVQNGSNPFTNYDAATDGTEIDETVGIDFAQATIQNNVIAQLLSVPKIGLDDIGIPIIEGAVRAGLSTCGQQGIIARAISDADLAKSDDKRYIFQVQAPTRATIATADLTSRTLRMTGSYTPLHGIASVNLTINVTL